MSTPTRTAVVRAAHYSATVAALLADPVLVAMSVELGDMPRDRMAHPGPDGGPRSEFMSAATAEYRRRGGTIVGHIGAVAEAILADRDSVAEAKADRRRHAEAR